MGYESRVYIVQEFEDGWVWENGMRSASIIAEFNLCCVEQEVLDVFKSNAEYCLIEKDEFITTDNYGAPLKCADIMALYNAIEYGKYWRTTALKEYLHGIINTRDIVTYGFGNLKAYHFGY